MTKVLSILSILIASITFSQNSILIEGGTIHVGNGKVINNGLIGIIDGKITLVKSTLTYTYKKTEWDTIISASNQHIYPGFVAPNTTLGLTEIDAVRATRDFDDVGIYNPHVRSLIAFNTESTVISTVRTNGVLIGQPTPRGGIISGSSSIVHFNGWNWEDAAINTSDGIHLNWPSSLNGGGWWAEPAPKKRNEKYSEQLQEIKTFFSTAKAYSTQKNSSEVDVRLEAMINVFKGNKRVYIHANELKALTDIISFVQEFDLQFPVIVGGYDAHLITKQLVDANIPVMLTRVHSLPENEDDDIDMAYKLPYLLQRDGVKFCLQNHGEMEAMNARNIPFLAGTAMAYGLSEEEAIRSVSLSSCEILGINDSYGSIEEGKSATLFVSQGNALEMMENKLSTALVNGEFMPLTNRQTELYLKYKKKYEENR